MAVMVLEMWIARIVAGKEMNTIIPRTNVFLVQDVEEPEKRTALAAMDLDTQPALVVEGPERHD